MSRTRAFAAVPLVLLMGGLGGCDSPPTAATAAADTVTLERMVRIGEITGDANYQFGRVSGVAGDGAGRIYVSDRMASVVRTYASDGAFLQQIGREGDGPGEFRHPTDLLFDEGDRLWVRDARRATVLAPRSSGGIPDSVVETRTFSGYTNWTSSARSRLIDGVYYYPDQILRSDEPPQYFYFGYDQEGVTGDTVRVPGSPALQTARAAHYMISPGTGRMVYGLNRAPYEAGPSWELSGRGTILGGSGESLLVETDRGGDTLRVIHLEGRRTVSAGERADSAAALRARIDSLPVPLKEVEGVSERVRERDLPDSVPGFLAVHTSTEGEVWVRRWPPEGQDGSYFDVYSADGELAGHFRIPQRLLSQPPPFIDGERIIAVVQDPETEVHQVVVYRVPVER